MAKHIVKVTEREETKVVKVQDISLEADFAKELAIMLLEGKGVITECSRDTDAPEFVGYGQTRMQVNRGVMRETVAMQLPTGITLEITRESLS